VAFHGPHQPGITTLPAQAHAVFLGLDLRPGSGLVDVRRLMRLLSDDAAPAGTTPRNLMGQRDGTANPGSDPGAGLNPRWVQRTEVKVRASRTRRRTA
jgi:deferrochelatase/peroxidase EfeB